MPPKRNNVATLSKENILSIIDDRMSEVFEAQYEDLKDKLITLMAKEVSKLQNRINGIEQDFQSLKEAQNSNTIAIIERSQECQSLQASQQNKCDSLSKDISHISEQLSNIQVDIENTKQLLRQNNIRLVGLEENCSSESEYELTSKVIEFSKQHLEITDITIDDVEEVYRLGRNNTNKPRDVIIKFKQRDTRNKFYRNRRKLYDADSKRSSTGMYINEDLTQYRQRLYYDTRNLRKKSAIFAAWTSTGTIMVKLQEDSQPERIETHRDLANLLRQNRIEVSEDE